MGKKLYRGTAILPLGYRERKHRAPVYLVIAKDPAEARAIIRQQEMKAIDIRGVTEIEDGCVVWTWHTYDKNEGGWQS